MVYLSSILKAFGSGILGISLILSLDKLITSGIMLNLICMYSSGGEFSTLAIFQVVIHEVLHRIFNGRTFNNRQDNTELAHTTTV